MSSELKLEIGNNNDHYESEVSHPAKMSISDIVSPKQHRSAADIPFQRLVRPNRSAQTSVASRVDHKEEKRDYATGKRPSGPLLSGASYCVSSCSMILLNKVVLSTYGFNAGISLMFYQNLISTVIVAALSICGAVSVEKLSWKLIRVWLPVNLIFVGMLVSGMFSLKYINIAMVTILKNVTNILTAIGEYYVFRRQQNRKVWTAMFLMIISAISGGITDLSFDTTGYAWQIVNCILTASYSVCIICMYLLLTLRMVMDKAKQVTKSGNLNEVSMVLLNNSLSLPFAVILILMFDEWQYVNCGYNANVLGSSNVKRIVGTCNQLHIYVAPQLIVKHNVFLGLAIAHGKVLVLWSIICINQFYLLFYSLVGSLNKIPISIAGIVLFNVPLSIPNLFSILFGLFAGVFFARAKMS
ncbi:hypothetical protein Cgig2_005011 [Carnegiea gigantea]|uniref:Sugar phosphate transporter domain-containing protein n=1 Tax=Carnegiea gigantea TaxID=171969 RepID=A0A9Q1KZB5_9CARY|nr:hypothetical protein Cgig2_005011 [Carnegiea gigantea]